MLHHVMMNSLFCWVLKRFILQLALVWKGCCCCSLAASHCQGPPPDEWTQTQVQANGGSGVNRPTDSKRLVW